MKSTGEVLGVEYTFEKALYKAFLASGFKVPTDGAILATIADRDKSEAVKLLKNFWNLGFALYATSGTAKALENAGVKVTPIKKKIEEGHPNVIDILQEGRIIDMIINTLTRGKEPGARWIQNQESCC